MELELSLRRALVTGCSRGIGFAVAKALVDEGAQVAICGRDRNALLAAAERLAPAGLRVVTVPADLQHPSECARAVHEAAEELGGLDILVKNADVNIFPARTSLSLLSETDITGAYVGKATAAILCTRAALPFLSRSTSPRVVCIGGLSTRTVPARPVAQQRMKRAR